MTSSLEIELLSVLSEARGVLTTQDSLRVLMGLLALRRALGGSLARLTAAHSPADALDGAVDAVRRTDQVVADALATLLMPLRRERSTVPALLRTVEHLAERARPSELLTVFARVCAEGVKEGMSGFAAANLLHLVTHLAMQTPGGRLADPFCGPGLILASAALDQQLRPSGVVGWERNVGAVALARAAFVALGVPGVVDEANALVAPPATDLFDAVVCAPPINMQAPPQLHLEAGGRFQFGVTTRHADWLFVQHVLSILDPEGTAAILTGKGMLFRSGSEAQVRRRLVEADIIDAVIGLPPGLHPGTSIATCILVLRRNRSSERSGSILCVDVPKDAVAASDLQIEVVTQILELWKNYRESSGLVRARKISARELEAAEFSLDPVRHLPTESPAEMRPIAELAEDLRAARAAARASAARLGRVLEDLIATCNPDTHR